MSILGITCLRDDGPYVAEWIAHHLASGFDRMLVLSHDCSDGSDALLDALAQDSRITHMSFSPKGKKSVQWQALKLIRDHPLLEECEWAMFFDCDEFLCLPHHSSIQTLLAELQNESGACDAVALPWRLFGSGGVRHHEEGLTPERFSRAAPMDLHFPLAHLFKTLCRPSAFRQLGVHRPRSKPSRPARWIGPDGAALPEGFSRSDAAISLYGLTQGKRLAWLNHYSLRSRQEFILKRARGLPNHMDREIGLTYWAERNWNSEEALDILPMMAQSKDVLNELLGLADVRGLLDACLAYHRTEYEALMQNIDTLRLDFRLGLLTGSTPPSAEEGRAFMAAQMRLLKEDRT